MKKNWRKEYFSIPNLMGYFRILMLPVFLTLYAYSDSTEMRLAAFAVLAVSLLTDLLDGWIARKFQMVTDFGKALDPAADKLTQGTLIFAAAFRYPRIWILVAVFLLKEAYMAAMGLYLKKKKQAWNGAQWYGKVCAAVLDMGLFALLVFTDIPKKVGDGIILCMGAVMLFSLVKYVRFHMNILNG